MARSHGASFVLTPSMQNERLSTNGDSYSSRSRNSPQVSVIICTLGSPERLPVLQDCIDSIARQIFRDFELLLIVDDDPAARRLAKGLRLHGLSCRTLVSHQKGLAPARNVGVAGAQGVIVAFLDDDTIPSENWLVDIVGQFTTEKVAGVCGPCLYPGETRRDELKRLTWYFDVLDSPSEMPALTDMMRGANMSFRTSVLGAVGGADPLLGKFAISEDLDLSLSMRSAGYHLVYCPSASVVHFDLPMGGCKPDMKWWGYTFVRNRLYIMLKHMKFFKGPKSIVGLVIWGSAKYARRLGRGNASAYTCLTGSFLFIIGSLYAVLLFLVGSKNRSDSGKPLHRSGRQSNASPILKFDTNRSIY